MHEPLPDPWRIRAALIRAGAKLLKGPSVIRAGMQEYMPFLRILLEFDRSGASESIGVYGLTWEKPGRPPHHWLVRYARWDRNRDNERIRQRLPWPAMEVRLTDEEGRNTPLTHAWEGVEAELGRLRYELRGSNDAFLRGGLWFERGLQIRHAEITLLCDNGLQRLEYVWNEASPLDGDLTHAVRRAHAVLRDHHSGRRCADWTEQYEEGPNGERDDDGGWSWSPQREVPGYP